jgi:hypothetical protein
MLAYFMIFEFGMLIAGLIAMVRGILNVSGKSITGLRARIAGLILMLPLIVAGLLLALRDGRIAFLRPLVSRQSMRMVFEYITPDGRNLMPFNIATAIVALLLVGLIIALAKSPTRAAAVSEPLPEPEDASGL